jgi:serine/threonine protein kinase
VISREESGFDFQVGETLASYRLEDVVGEGAIGVVYRAVSPDGRTVALKVLKSAVSADQSYRERFRREARVAREVQHRHLVPILEAGEVDGWHYLVADYVRGGSLEERLQAVGRLTIEETLRIAAEVGAGLDALHRQRLVHRDVKPSNIMLDEEGVAALTDFGLAKGPAYTVLTRPGMVMGTIDYLAPELIRGEPATPASDIYSLGCVVYECLVGSAPFETESPLEVITAHLEREPPDPSLARDGLPADLGATLLRALAKEPSERPATARLYTRMLTLAARTRSDDAARG